jgi:hypothetical protein
MSNQMESLTKEVFALRDTAADAESHKKLAGISLEMRDKAVKLDEDLRMATIHFQKELARQERYTVLLLPLSHLPLPSALPLFSLCNY